MIAINDHINKQQHSRRIPFTLGPLRRDLDLAYLQDISGSIDHHQFLVSDRHTFTNILKLTIWLFAATVIYSLIFNIKDSSFAQLVFIGLIMSIFVAIAYYVAQKMDLAYPNPKYYPLFDRDRGTMQVWIPFRGTKKVRFRDLEAYVPRTPFNILSDYLLLVHYRPGSNKKDFSIRIDFSSGFRHEEDVIRAWSFLCRYMDKTRPLPNVPDLWVYILDEQGYVDEADHLQKMDEVIHEYVLTCVQNGYKDPLPEDMDYLNPLYPSYTGPRTYEYYKNLDKKIS